MNTQTLKLRTEIYNASRKRGTGLKNEFSRHSGKFLKESDSPQVELGQTQSFYMSLPWDKIWTARHHSEPDVRSDAHRVASRSKSSPELVAIPEICFKYLRTKSKPRPKSKKLRMISCASFIQLLCSLTDNSISPPAGFERKRKNFLEKTSKDVMDKRYYKVQIGPGICAFYSKCKKSPMPIDSPNDAPLGKRRNSYFEELEDCSWKYTNHGVRKSALSYHLTERTAKLALPVRPKPPVVSSTKFQAPSSRLTITSSHVSKELRRFDSIVESVDQYLKSHIPFSPKTSSQILGDQPNILRELPKLDRMTFNSSQVPLIFASKRPKIDKDAALPKNSFSINKYRNLPDDDLVKKGFLEKKDCRGDHIFTKKVSHSKPYSAKPSNLKNQLGVK